MADWFFVEDPELLRLPNSDHDTNEDLEQVQRASFCLTAHILSQPNTNNPCEVINCRHKYDDNVKLQDVGYLNRPLSAAKLSQPTLGKVALILHILGNRVVAEFSRHLEAYFTGHENFRAEWGGGWAPLRNQPKPPTIEQLPLVRLIDPPTPFSGDCARPFHTCHLAKMATPEFFEQGEWTGYLIDTTPVSDIWRPWHTPICGVGVEVSEIRIESSFS